MTEEKKEGGCCEGRCGCSGNSGGSCCRTSKFTCGFLLGLVLAAAGIGLYKMGKCAGSHKCMGKECPMAAAQAPAAQSAK